MNIYPRSTSFSRALFALALSILVARTPGWWAQVDSNHRPRAYQARALTTWAMSPCKFRCISFSRTFPQSTFSRALFALGLSISAVGTADLVEMMGIEPMTPCLQGRCSPSWATPPLEWKMESGKLKTSSPFAFPWGFLLNDRRTDTQNWTTMKEALSSRCALSPSFLVLVYTNTKDQWLSHYLSCSP